MVEDKIGGSASFATERTSRQKGSETQGAERRGGRRDRTKEGLGGFRGPILSAESSTSHISSLIKQEGKGQGRTARIAAHK